MGNRPVRRPYKGSQLQEYLYQFHLISHLQSAYGRGQSTESVLLDVFSEAVYATAPDQLAPCHYLACQPHLIQSNHRVDLIAAMNFFVSFVK